jgi:hypothetical protein
VERTFAFVTSEGLVPPKRPCQNQCIRKREASVATVTVFVDDAVLGRLPPVCVKNGTWTNDHLTFTQDVGGRTGLGIAWLLLLAGPLGWIGLFIIGATRQNNELLTVTLPFSEAAHLRLMHAERARIQAMWVAMGAFVAGFVALLFRTTDSRLLALVLVVVVAGALVRMIMETIRVGKAHVRLSLDASRRWVTLSGVHPDFQATIQRADRQSSTNPSG